MRSYSRTAATVDDALVGVVDQLIAETVAGT